MTDSLLPSDGVAKELSQTTAEDQCSGRMTGLASKTCDNPLVKAVPDQPECRPNLYSVDSAI
jgi:hypothetical protein